MELDNFPPKQVRQITHRYPNPSSVQWIALMDWGNPDSHFPCSIRSMDGSTIATVVSALCSSER
jgi:hypothetical protein